MVKLDGHPGEHWIKDFWRPAMAVQYLVVCVFDFLVFPIINFGLASLELVAYRDWHPLTLQGGGLYHLSMGAVVGVTAWQRTNEKIASMNYYGNGNSYTERQEDKVTTPSSRRD
jgi:hypothetical protein